MNVKPPDTACAIRCIALFLVSSACWSFAHARNAERVATAYEKYSLPNGMEVILAPVKRLPIVAVNLWYHNQVLAADARVAMRAQAPVVVKAP